MQIRSDYNFLEQFLAEPHPVYLFGTKGVIKNYIPYIKLLHKFNICPKGLVSDNPEAVGERILETKVMTYSEWGGVVLIRMICIFFLQVVQKDSKRKI